MTKKETKKKDESTKKPVEKFAIGLVPDVKLISYTMKATIPVMQYGNIQPEITVTAGSIAEAEEVCLGYIEALFARYNKQEEVREEKLPVINVPKDEMQDIKPSTSIYFTSAKNMLNAATGEDARKAVIARIKESTKLTDEEKKTLLGHE